MAHRDIFIATQQPRALGALRISTSLRHAVGARRAEGYGSFKFVIWSESATSPRQRGDFWPLGHRLILQTTQD